jgi:GWxTD domain-containing protein
VLYDKDNNFVKEITTQQTINEIYYNLTSSDSEANNVVFTFNVKPAKYRLLLLLADKNSNISREFKEDIVVRTIDSNQLALSDIQVASLIEPSEENTNFVKNGRKIISRPSRNFDSNFLFAQFYFEIYNLSMKTENQQNSFTFHYIVTDKRKDTIFEFTNDFSKPAKSSAINFTVPTSDLAPGEYSLSIEVIDNDSQDKAITETYFFIDKSLINNQLADYDKALEMLKVIANRKEIKKLKKTAQDNRQQALTNFWKSKDPTPGTTENEFMVEFYSRVDYTNKAFTVIGREGWKTDRGKIFLRYGQPDKINRSTSKYGWEKYEIWEYYRLDLRYVFIDRNGFGDFQLVRNSYYDVN